MDTAMRSLLLIPPFLWLALGASAGPHRPSTDSMPMTASVSLFTFDRADEAQWDVVNDGVMGGRSAGFVAVEQGTLRFTGTLVTQGGGFTSVRARRAVDLTGQLGIEMRVRGSGRQFEVELDDGVRGYGRTVSRRAPFPTSSEWTVVRVPFSALRSTIFGREVNAPAIDVARIRGLGLYMADGQDGPFRLEVDYVRTYGDGPT
jgi:NADH dehydrogenase [ubiquinone] 1 alpha subcomplex assembly factor 1